MLKICKRTLSEFKERKCKCGRCEDIKNAEKRGYEKAYEETQVKINEILSDCYNEKGFSEELWIKHYCYSRLKSIIAKTSIKEANL